MGPKRTMGRPAGSTLPVIRGNPLPDSTLKRPAASLPERPLRVAGGSSSGGASAMPGRSRGGAQRGAEHWYRSWEDPGYVDEMIRGIQIDGYIEFCLIDAEGVDRGSVLGVVREKFAVDHTGCTLGLEIAAAESPRVAAWLADLATESDGVVYIHLCRGQCRTCPYQVAGWTICHTDQFRSRNADSITEQWALDGTGDGHPSSGEEDRRDRGDVLGARSLGLPPTGPAPKVGPRPSGQTRAGPRAGGGFDGIMSLVDAADPANVRTTAPMAESSAALPFPPPALPPLSEPPVAAKETSGGFGPEKVAKLKAKLRAAQEELANKGLSRTPATALSAAEISSRLSARAAGLQPVPAVKEAPSSRVIADAASSSDEETSSKSVFRKAPSARSVQKLAREQPGVLLRQGLEMMSKYLDPLAGGGGATQKQMVLEPKVVRYLTTMSAAARHTGVGLRNERELRTLAESIDALLEGDLCKAGDILMMRFKAVEFAATESDWSAAKFLEVIPEGTVTSLTPEEREAIAHRKAKEAKLQKLLREQAGTPAAGRRS